jgi:methylornithine synthase
MKQRGKSVFTVESVLLKAKANQPLADEEILFLLNLEAPLHIDALFKTARDLRRQYFGNSVFLYGFLHTSTYCSNDCRFCFFRRSNPQSRRYRKTEPEILSAVDRLVRSGVHLIDVTMGEDPEIFDENGGGFDRLVDLVTGVVKKAALPVMVSPGVVPENILHRLADAGAVWYACYQETHGRELFAELRPGQDYDLRLEAKQAAHRHGLLIEEGLLCGVGETPSDIVRSIDMMRRLDADQVRVMTFVPQPGTPMEKRNLPEFQTELIISSVLRLVFPDRLIPASLDVEGLDGLKKRLNAGANVVTSIVPPGSDLAGVARHEMDIEEGRRTSETVRFVLQDCGLRPANPEAYQNWVKGRQEVIDHSRPGGRIACGSA